VSWIRNPVAYWYISCLTSFNSYSTALLIGEKAAVLVAEDLGYSGEALDMKVPTYYAPGEMKLPFRV
jgi:alcohol oxidase